MSMRDELLSGHLSELDQEALREFIQKYLRISTWPHHIPIHNLLPLKKDRKNEQVGHLTSSHT